MTIARAQRRNGLLLGADLALFMAALGAMSTGFLVVYAVGRLGATDELAAWYTAVVLLAQVVANPGLGWLADRHGFGAAGQASALAGAVALGGHTPLHPCLEAP